MESIQRLFQTLQYHDDMEVSEETAQRFSTRNAIRGGFKNIVSVLYHSRIIYVNAMATEKKNSK